MVGLTTDDVRGKESKVMRKRNANREQNLLMDMIDPQKIKTLEIGFGADTRYDDGADTRYDEKYEAKIQQHRSQGQVLEKGGHEVKLYPIISPLQCSILNCLKAAMTAVEVNGPHQAAIARRCKIMLCHPC